MCPSVRVTGLAPGLLVRMITGGKRSKPVQDVKQPSATHDAYERDFWDSFGSEEKEEVSKSEARVSMG